MDAEKNFRMLRSLFFDLCDELRPFITKSRTPSSSYTIVPLNKGCMRKFWLARNTVSKIICCVRKSISTQLASKYIQLPYTKEEVQYSTAFVKHGFPPCIGAIDGAIDTHVEIVKPH